MGFWALKRPNTVLRVLWLFSWSLMSARYCAYKDAKNKHGNDTTIIIFFYKLLSFIY